MMKWVPAVVLSSEVGRQVGILLRDSNKKTHLAAR
ncbi:hypothetical protein CLV59_104562 [Chitinophaga dinghuensis]|uniref:Uncharacterized protein n=1 Tax=Chitinophaga dinghuensis TaxID=1539050 RepID=A0A327W2A0_9BACT|nr:hypothetical protein CLV59_104562 [Chitinophaga dinghuensis]